MGKTIYIHPEMETFHQRFKQLVEESDMSQAEIARQTSMTHAMVWHLCEGRSVPSVGRLISICDFFHLSADWLLGRSDDPVPEGLTGKYKQMAESYIKYLMMLQRRDAQLKAK